MNLCQKYGRNTTCFLGSQTNFLLGVAIGFCMFLHLGSSGSVVPRSMKINGTPTSTKFRHRWHRCWLRTLRSCDVFCPKLHNRWSNPGESKNLAEFKVETVETPHPKGHLFGHPPGHLAEKDANNYQQSQQSQYISISYPPNTKPLHKAPGWERTLLPWRGMGLVAPFCHTDLRPQHRSTMVTQFNLDQVQTPRPLLQFWNKLPSTRCRI